MPYFPLVSVTFRRCPVTYGYAVLRSRLNTHRSSAIRSISNREDKGTHAARTTSAKAIASIEAEAAFQ
jgi:hypothetical protein